MNAVKIEAAISDLAPQAFDRVEFPFAFLAAFGEKDTASGESIAPAYPDFSNHFGFFLPLAGISTIKEIKDNPVDRRATGRLEKLFELYIKMTAAAKVAPKAKREKKA